MLQWTLLSAGVQLQAASRSTLASSSRLAQRPNVVVPRAFVVERQPIRQLTFSHARREEQKGVGAVGDTSSEQSASTSSSSAAESAAKEEQAASTTEASSSPTSASSRQSVQESRKNMWDSLLKGSLFSQSTGSIDSLTGRRSGVARPLRGGPQLSMRQEMEEAWRNQPRFGAARPGVASDGRAVDIEIGRTDLARAFSQLNILLRRNNVRRELKLVERYEKPNQKRRRLRSERHRRRFADAVYQKVQLVMRLKSRGA